MMTGSESGRRTGTAIARRGAAGETMTTMIGTGRGGEIVTVVTLLHLAGRGAERDAATESVIL